MTAPHYVLERPLTGAWLVWLDPRRPSLYPPGDWMDINDGSGGIEVGPFRVSISHRVTLLAGPAWFTDLDARVHVWCEERRAVRLDRRETAARRIVDRRARHDA